MPRGSQRPSVANAVSDPVGSSPHQPAHPPPPLLSIFRLPLVPSQFFSQGRNHLILIYLPLRPPANLLSLPSSPAARLGLCPVTADAEEGWGRLNDAWEDGTFLDTFEVVLLNAMFSYQLDILVDFEQRVRAERFDEVDDIDYLVPPRPPGPFIDSDNADPRSDDFQALDSAPEHLRRVSNEQNPIVLDDSDDEVAVAPRPPRKRARGVGFELELVTRAPKRVGQAHAAKSSVAPPSAARSAGGPSHVKPVNHVIAASLPLPNVPEVSAIIPVSEPAPEDYLPSLLEILPDLDIDWALLHLRGESSIGRKDDPVGRVIALALEMDRYPTVKAGKATKNVIEGSYKDVAFRADKRVGSSYVTKSLATLQDIFPRVPVAHISKTFLDLQSLLAPTCIRLFADAKALNQPFQELKRGRIIRGAGKGKAKVVSWDGGMSNPQSFISAKSSGALEDDNGEAEFLEEYTWVEAFTVNESVEAQALEDKRLAIEKAIADGEGIECGCCFGAYILKEMFQCAEGHLFCRECATKNAETKLGEHSIEIKCMDMSDCPAPFTDPELTRLLPIKSLYLFHRLQQADELVKAGIEGLETCPSCPFAAVIENDEEKLFRCMNEMCAQVTCRKCRRAEHLPKSCKEMQADSKRDKRHTVEDAMSDALIRKCPKCAKPFVKDTGCNKMHCSHCRTDSCYVCRQAIPEGYAHFDQNPRDYTQPKQTQKCPLWEADEHVRDRIIAARDAAQAEVRAAAEAEGIILADADLQVAAPDQPAQPPRHQGGLAAGMLGLQYIPRGLALPEQGNVHGVVQQAMMREQARIIKHQARLQQPPIPGVDAPPLFHPILREYGQQHPPKGRMAAAFQRAALIPALDPEEQANHLAIDTGAHDAPRLPVARPPTVPINLGQANLGPEARRAARRDRPDAPPVERPARGVQLPGNDGVHPGLYPGRRELALDIQRQVDAVLRGPPNPGQPADFAKPADLYRHRLEVQRPIMAPCQYHDVPVADLPAFNPRIVDPPREDFLARPGAVDVAEAARGRAILAAHLNPEEVRIRREARAVRAARRARFAEQLVGPGPAAIDVFYEPPPGYALPPYIALLD